jgi:hypothetical protein
MELTIGSYRLQLPGSAVLPGPLEPSRPFRSFSLARIGPFGSHASLLNGTLQEWRETVSQATKNSAQFFEINVNGIPGVKLPGTTQRLDYVFQTPGEMRLEVVAWSDRATSSDEQQVIEDAIQTLQIPPPLILPGAGT